VVDIILVRHASTSWSGVRYCGISDPPLSPTGLAEARRLAERLAPDLPPDCRIVSSPSRRALATASAIADAARAPGVSIDPRWQEADVGVAEGRTFDELTEIAAFDAFYKRMIARIEIRDVSSAFAMEQIKYTTEVPLGSVVEE